MKLFRVLRRAFHLIRVNRRAFASFELIWKTTVAVLLVAAMDGLTKLSMRLTGYAYLTRENLFSYVLHPITLASILLWTLLAATCALVDLSGVVYMVDRSRRGVRCRLDEILAFSARNTLRAWRLRNLPMLLVLLGIAPLLNAGLAAGLLTGLSLPEIVEDAFRANRLLFIGGAAALLLVALPLMRWLFAFHSFTLEGRSSRDALRRSARLTRLRHRRVKSYAVLLLGQVAFGGAMVLSEIVMVLLGRLLGRLFAGAFRLQAAAGALPWYALVLSLVLSALTALPVGCGCVGVMYYRVTRDEVPEPATGASRRELTVGRLPRAALWVGTVALLAVDVLILGALQNSGALNPQIEYLRVPEITAHRGASALYPENTMAAFVGARELGADWVELDVQQTKDGQIVVLHDPDTKRTTGVSGRIWNMTYEQVAQLDAGSRFGPEFAGEPIPLLSQVCEYASQSGVKLNIELKPTGHETDFEQGVIDIVKAYGIEDRCVITSQVYSVLRRVKAIDEAITTVYVTSLAYGSIDYMASADHFSVEATSATKKLVSRVHNSGSQIYAWTVNTRHGINRMIDRNVDNIITDDVELARQCVIDSRYGDLLSDIVKTVDEQP